MTAMRNRNTAILAVSSGGHLASHSPGWKPALPQV